MKRALLSGRGLWWVACPLLLCVGVAFIQLQLLERDSGLDTALNWVTRCAWLGQDWPGYRSRLLGIATIELLGGNVRAFLTVTFVSLFFGGTLAWYLGGAGGFGVYHAAFALVAWPWFAPWDMFRPVFFTAFVIFAVELRPWWWFVLLFALAIVDHQSAMYMGLFMVLQGGLTGRRALLFAGFSCLLMGFAYMWLMQHTDWRYFGFSTQSFGYHTDYADTHFSENLHHLFGEGAYVPCIYGVIMLTIATVMVRGQLALGLTFAALLASLTVVGILSETRVYLTFLPLLVLAASPPASAPPQQSALLDSSREATESMVAEL